MSVLLLVLGALSLFVTAQSASASLSSTCKSSGYTCVEGGYNASTMNNNWATKYYGSGGGVNIGNPPHNCTLYAAWMLAKNGAPNPGRSWGNAKDWGHVLASVTNGNPTVGSIAWYDAGRSGIGSSGHVGYVAQVNSSNGTVFIESDNYMGGSAGYTSSGWVSISSPSGYIHVKDVASGGGDTPSLATVDSAGHAYAKQGLGGTWVHEIDSVSAVAVASDPTNGPSLAVISGGSVYAKQGLGGTWIHETDGASSLALASDATGGPTLAVVNTAGQLYAKQGLGGTWVHEIDSVSAVAVASDPTNGPSLAVISGGSVYAKQGLGGTWIHETDGASSLALASDATNGPSLAEITGGTVYAKQGLGGTWLNEIGSMQLLALAG